ncbi:hypothetical protein H0H92_011990, partial [Tricholoma furcatifolium]
VQEKGEEEEKEEEREDETDGETYEDEAEISRKKGKGKMTQSDLLKAIHYFASSYYHDRGQLFDATKEYRQIRKRNKLRRLKEQGECDESWDDSTEPSDEDSEESEQKGKGGKRKGVGRRNIYRKDMYKVLDGSALMAIGMLMQEYVSRTLEPRVPDGWEEMMREFYAEMENNEVANNNGSGVEGTDESSDEDEDEQRPGQESGQEQEQGQGEKDEEGRASESESPSQENKGEGSDEDVLRE